jgi:hypothetical protein
MYFDNSFSLVTSKTIVLHYDVLSTPIPGIPVPATTQGTILSIVWILLALVVIVGVVGNAKAAAGSRRTAAAQAATPNNPEVGNFCKYCGGRITNDTVFCSRCGRSLK